eukprot:153053_1
MTSILTLFMALFATQLLTNIEGAQLVKNLVDSKFGASSEYDTNCEARDAKLASSNSWCAIDENGGDWLQVDLGQDYVLESVTTKGRDSGDNEWTTRYTLKYKQAGGSWKDYATNINANSDKTSSKVVPISGYKIARYVRFYPTVWNNWPSMRVEVNGHLPTDSPTPSPT